METTLNLKTPENIMKEYTVKVDEDGTKRWYNSAGQHHREGGPAVECPSGTKFWYKNGQFHREDGPAIEWWDGAKSWYKNGQLHREDGPAFENSSGSKFWFLNGQEVTEAEVLGPCTGKIVEIDGIKYKLTKV